LVERYKKSNGRCIGIYQERIVEVDFKKCGVHVPAFKMRLPKHKNKNTDADEHNDCLEK
jgi:hypothetical protein